MLVNSWHSELTPLIGDLYGSFASQRLLKLEHPGLIFAGLELYNGLHWSCVNFFAGLPLSVISLKGATVAKPNSRGINFELLENRCLLNGTIFTSPPKPPGHWDALTQYAEMQPQQMILPPSNDVHSGQPVAGPAGPPPHDVTRGPVPMKEDPGPPPANGQIPPLPPGTELPSAL